MIQNWDLQITSLALYQLSYRHIVMCLKIIYFKTSKIMPQTLDQ